MNSETIFGKTYSFYPLRGVVTKVTNQTIPIVKGQTNGGYAYENGVYIPKIDVSTTLQVEQDIYIADSNGKQSYVKLINWDMPCMEGHAMSFVRDSQNDFVYAVRNETLRKTNFSFQIKEICSRTNKFGCGIVIFAFAAVFYICYLWVKNNLGRGPTKSDFLGDLFIYGACAFIAFIIAICVLRIIGAFGLNDKILDVESHNRLRSSIEQLL